MASSSPPPPPDPNRPNNPFASGSCGGGGPSARPTLRRSKTLANPESPTRWRREPLADVTNAILGPDRLALGRLQRIDPDLLRLPAFTPASARGGSSAPIATAENTPSSPSPSTSRLPRSTALRRTRSAAPAFRSSAGGEPSTPTTSAQPRAFGRAVLPQPPSLSTSTSPFTPAAVDRPRTGSPSAGAALLTPPATGRALRPRPQRPADADSTFVSAAPARRSRTVSNDNTAVGPASPSWGAVPSPSSSSLSQSPASSATPSSSSSSSRRRTFGGMPSASVTPLASVVEDDHPSPSRRASAAVAVEAGASTTPMASRTIPQTRQRSASDGEGEGDGGRATRRVSAGAVEGRELQAQPDTASDLEGERRLRRRRTLGGVVEGERGTSEPVGVKATRGMATPPSSSQRRKGLR